MVLKRLVHLVAHDTVTRVRENTAPVRLDDHTIVLHHLFQLRHDFTTGVRISKSVSHVERLVEHWIVVVRLVPINTAAVSEVQDLNTQRTTVPVCRGERVVDPVAPEIRRRTTVCDHVQARFAELVDHRDGRVFTVVTASEVRVGDFRAGKPL